MLVSLRGGKQSKASHGTYDTYGTRPHGTVPDLIAQALTQSRLQRSARRHANMAGVQVVPHGLKSIPRLCVCVSVRR